MLVSGLGKDPSVTYYCKYTGTTQIYWKTLQVLEAFECLLLVLGEEDDFVRQLCLTCWISFAPVFSLIYS